MLLIITMKSELSKDAIWIFLSINIALFIGVFIILESMRFNKLNNAVTKLHSYNVRDIVMKNDENKDITIKIEHFSRPKLVINIIVTSIFFMITQFFFYVNVIKLSKF